MTQLVYGYNLDNAGNLTLQVYDPNDNSNDNSTISLNISVPAHTNTISAPGIEAAIADPATIRGLFRAAYNYTNPSALQLMPYPGVWTGVDRSSVGSFTGAGRDELLYYWAGRRAVVARTAERHHLQLDAGRHHRGFRQHRRRPDLDRRLHRLRP